jgi:hypothetical protein
MNYTPDVVDFVYQDFAYQIIDMQRIIEKQAEEIERLQEYQKRYHQLLNRSISEGEQMIRQLTELVMK